MIRRFAVLAAALPLLFFCQIAAAHTYPVYTIDTDGSRSSASCVCIGYTDDRDGEEVCVFLTNRHVAKDVKSIYVTGDDVKWHKGSEIVIDNSGEDLASFVVRRSKAFRRTKLMDGVPDGTGVWVCGYSPRTEFCFRGVLSDWQVKAGGKHVIPGDSGGSILACVNGENYLAGIIIGYGNQDLNTHIVTAEKCCRHIQRVFGKSPKCYSYKTQCPGGGCPPSYRRYERVRPHLLRPPSVERYEEIRQPQRQIDPAQIRTIVREWLDEHKDELRGRDGKDGETVDINVRDVATYIVENYADEIRGQDGAPGAPGLDGLPGEAGPEGPPGPLTTYSDQHLIDLLADDPRVQSLIARLEALEAAASVPVNVEGIEQRLKQLENRKRRVILKEDGKTIDEAELGADDPLILDLKRIIRK